MIAHYLAVAFAKFCKTPFTTAANVLTLALGLACFIAAYGIATYWRSADTYHPNADRIFVVGKSLVYPGDDKSAFLGGQTSGVEARYLREDFPELEPIARLTTGFPAAAASGSATAELFVARADPALLDLFSFDFIAGDPATALEDPTGAVLTQDAAARLFGDAPALGQSVLVNQNEEHTVTGVIAPVRQPSFMGSGPNAALRFDMLTHFVSSAQAAYWESDGAWINFSMFTFVTLPPGMSADVLNARLAAFAENRVPAELRDTADISFTAFPLGQLATRGLDDALFAQAGVDLSVSAVLIGLGALILAVACLNYANLATAQAAGRAKEVGMRKVLGASRVQVMSQSWLEAGVLTLAALLAALAALAVAAPAVKASAGIDLLYFLAQGVAPIGVVLALAVVVSLAAGAYPALVLSRLRPAAALQTGRSRTGPRLVARILVGVQFASASFLLILVTVAQLERTELERVALTPHEDPIVALGELYDFDVSFDTLKNRLLADPAILSVAASDWAPLSRAANVVEFARSPEVGAAAPSASVRHVGDDYFATLDVGLLAGRVFDPEREQTSANIFDTDPAQTYSIVIDRAYAQALGFASPAAAVGEVIYVPSSSVARRGGPAQPMRIVGVTETELARLDAVEPEGQVYFDTSGAMTPVVKIARDDVPGALAAIADAWEELVPNVPLKARFFDELFEASFRTYARVGQVFILLASAAFAIASIGILGMAVNVTSRRRHEIGVRKTLGSTTIGVIRLLLVDFSKPVLVANLLAWPLGYLAAQTYLSAFAHRVALTPAPFALSMAITFAIAWAAVIGEVLKAASVRPAEVLRHA